MELLPIHCFGWMLRQFSAVCSIAYATQAEVKFELNSENLFPKEKGGKEQQRYYDYC